MRLRQQAAASLLFNPDNRASRASIAQLQVAVCMPSTMQQARQAAQLPTWMANALASSGRPRSSRPWEEDGKRTRGDLVMKLMAAGLDQNHIYDFRLWLSDSAAHAPCHSAACQSAALTASRWMTAMSVRVWATSGECGPPAASQMARARSYSGSAAAVSPRCGLGRSGGTQSVM